MGARCRARPRCADSRRQGAVAAFPRQLAPGRGGGEKMGVAYDKWAGLGESRRGCNQRGVAKEQVGVAKEHGGVA